MCILMHFCLGAVDGGEAEGIRWSIRGLGGVFVSTVPGPAKSVAGEGGGHCSAGAASGGAGKHTL